MIFYFKIICGWIFNLDLFETDLLNIFYEPPTSNTLLFVWIPLLFFIQLPIFLIFLYKLFLSLFSHSLYCLLFFLLFLSLLSHSFSPITSHISASSSFTASLNLASPATVHRLDLVLVSHLLTRSGFSFKNIFVIVCLFLVL